MNIQEVYQGLLEGKCYAHPKFKLGKEEYQQKLVPVNGTAYFWYEPDPEQPEFTPWDYRYSIGSLDSPKNMTFWLDNELLESQEWEEVSRPEDFHPPKKNNRKEKEIIPIGIIENGKILITSSETGLWD